MWITQTVKQIWIFAYRLHIIQLDNIEMIFSYLGQNKFVVEFRIIRDIICIEIQLLLNQPRQHGVDSLYRK